MSIKTKMKSLEWKAIFIPGYIPEEDEQDIADLIVNEKQVKDHMKTKTELTGLPFRMLYHYARINPELPNKKGDKTFEKHFFESLTSVEPKLGAAHLSFPQDFKPLIDDMYAASEAIKEEKKAYNKLHAKERKEKSAAIKAKYGIVQVNGKDEEIAGYMLEAEGIFFGRGNSPFNGYWKFAVEPEDVAINWISSKPAPAAPKGHHWKSVDHDENRHEIATYNIRIGTAKKTLDIRRKKIQFSPNSSLKKEAEQSKYSKTSHLVKRYDDFCKYVEDGLRDPSTEQQAFVAWLIQQTGIRIGNETGEDGQSLNGTVGAGTLKMRNIKVSGNDLSLHFLGKDSVMYDNTIEMPDNVTVVLSKMTKGKSDDDNIVTVPLSYISDYLHKFDKDLTPKLIRTQVANKILQDALADIAKSSKVTKTSSDAQKLNVFRLANLEVAKKLNHQKNVAKTFNESYEKSKESLANRKEKLTEYETKQRTKIAKLQKLIKGASTSEIKAVYQERLDKAKLQLKKREDSIQNAASRLILKEKSKNITLGTSLNSYISPVIVADWCEEIRLPIEKVYNKTQMKKFGWAFTTK